MQENKAEQNDALETEAVDTVEAEKEAENVTEKESKCEKNDKKKIKKLEAELEEAKKNADEINEKYMRMLAEYDNFRKRSAKERESIYSDAYSDALKSILPVLDNLERAESCKEFDGLSKGLELTLKSFVDTLTKLGVEEIESMGKTFDPNVHNAVFHVEDEEHGENEIVEVLMKGYKRGDKVIRYAMVKVAN